METVDCSQLSDCMYFPLTQCCDLAGRPGTGNDRRANRRHELHLPGGDMRRSRRSSRCFGACGRANVGMLLHSLPRAARSDVDVPNNVNARHWKRLREAFLRCIADRDFIGCLIVQEIMLESFAVASYARVGKVGPGSLGKTFAAIAAEEEEHIDHAMEILRAERALDPQRFDDKVYRLHLDVMTTLAEMLAKECRTGHCEVCHGSCVKPSLPDGQPDLRPSCAERHCNSI